MRLNYITLKNFRQYYGEQTVHFATDGPRHVTVIHGINGAGKTSLCIAMNWCLYGDAFVREKFGTVGELASKHPAANIASVDTSVKIGFTYQDIQYWAERQRLPLRNNQTTLLLQGENDVHPRRDADASDMILSMIPEDVSIHFFFDGEKIDNFARPGHEKEVMNAMRNVLKIEVVRRGITHLNGVAQDYAQDLKKELRTHPSEALQTLINEEEAEKQRHSKLVSDIASKRQGVEKANAQIQDVDEQLESIEESRQLAEERARIQSTLKQLQQGRAGLQKEIRKLANDGFIPIAKPAVDKALAILDANEIPSVPEPILLEILEQLHCLCGRDIHRGSLEYQTIRNLLAKAVSSKASTVVRETYNHLRYLLRSPVTEIPASLQEVLSDNQRLGRDIAASQARLDKIAEQLVDFNQEDIRNLQRSRSEYERAIGRLETEIIQTDAEIREISGEISDLKEKIKLAKASEGTVEQLIRYKALAEDAASALERINAFFTEDIREKVESEVQEIFQRLVWKDSHFRDVRLSDHFELQVIDRFGEQARPEMSAGERQVLSLAFILAMAKVASQEMPLNMEDEPFPIVMDTPFGRLSTQPRENITVTIPQIAKQLILFVTDEELHGQARANLEPSIGAEYQLQFNQSTSVTTIVPISS